MSASGLAAHLSPAELGQRYRAARSPVERSHLRIVWLPSRGRGEREVARVTGHGRRGVGEVARRYDEGGPDGLGDRRRRNVGGEPLLGAEDEAALGGAATAPPPPRGRGAARGRGGGGAPGGRAGGAARRRGAMDGAEGGGVDGDPARPQGLAAAGGGLPQEARPQRAGAE